MTLKENGLFWRHSPQRYFHVEVSFVPFFPQKQNLSLSSCQLSIVMFKINFVLLLFVHLALVCWRTSHNSFLGFNDVRACLLVVFLNLFSKSSFFCHQHCQHHHHHRQGHPDLEPRNIFSAFLLLLLRPVMWLGSIDKSDCWTKSYNLHEIRYTGWFF